MRDSFKHEASGATLCREIAQPHVTTFAEVFTDWKPYNLFSKDRKHAFEPRVIRGQAIAENMFQDVSRIMRGGKSNASHPDHSMYVGPFCSYHGSENSYFDAVPADWVLSRIRERTIIVPGDTMSFELNRHDNGWTLVTVHHGRILGSVWLAYIKTDSIPVCNL